MIANDITTKITQEDYVSKWEPAGWNILHLGITPNWRTEWGTWESIRDIVQNALDETEAFTVTQLGDSLEISDNGTGLAVKDLFLGGQKPKESYQRGKFGEGLKVAALSLLRDGYGFSIRTVGKDIIFCMFQQNIDDSPISTLSALWRINQHTSGTTATIHGYDYNEEPYEDRFTQTANLDILHKSKSGVAKPSQRYNVIYKAKRGQACVFARNIYMREIDGEWSYDLWDFELSPDRHAPRYDFQMWDCIARLWQTVTDENLMVSFFKAIRDKTADYIRRELDMVSMQSTITPDGIPYIKIMESQSDKWNRAFVKVFGNGSVLRTGGYETQMEALGKTSIALPQGLTTAMGSVIKTDKSMLVNLVDITKEVSIIDDSYLDMRQLLILNSARELNDGLSKPVVGLFASHLPIIDGNSISAEYHRKTDQILFAPLSLSSWDTMFKALVHELGHSYSGGGDCTYAHVNGMEKASAELATYIASHPNYYQRYKSIITP